MTYLYLSIELPRLSDEQAAAVQQTLYAFIDAFDAHYCSAIERYHKNLSNPENIKSTIQQIILNDPPF